MIVSFFGHSHFVGNKELEMKIIAYLEETVGAQVADIYLGGYGEFDRFAYECCKKYKENHPSISLVFVTPYLTVEYQRNHLENKKTRYDAILYPEIEDKPLKFAIVYRNRYMVEKADFVVAYITHDWGGAYKTYQYAKRKKKFMFNISDEEF